MTIILAANGIDTEVVIQQHQIVKYPYFDLGEILIQGTITVKDLGSAARLVH
jgi:hypothetical protein